MIDNNNNKKKKNVGIGTVVWLLLVLIGSTGSWVIVPLLFFAIPALGVYFFIKMSKQNANVEQPGRPGTSQTDPGRAQTSYGRMASPNVWGRTAMPTPKEPRRRSSVPDEMLSDSERVHLTSLGNVSHDEFLHRSQELSDLLHAGIIEQDEYSDRLNDLRKEHGR